MRYFILISSFEKNVPRLVISDESPDYLYEKGPIEDPNRLIFELGDPVPRKPVFVDFHQATHSVISSKAAEILKSFQARNVQFLPLSIKLRNQNLNDYWVIHSFSQLAALDHKNSVCEIKRRRLANVKKLKLDTSKLSSIPLEERLIFRMEEDYSYELFHESIVEGLALHTLRGLRFIPLEEWNSSSFF